MNISRIRHAAHQGCVDAFVASRYYKKNSSAPDYTPMANASKEAAEIGAQLGREQMAQAQAQYDQNMAVARPIIDMQLAQQQQTMAQGEDYYNYMMSRQRPVEDALNQESMNYGTVQNRAFDGAMPGGRTLAPSMYAPNIQSGAYLPPESVFANYDPSAYAAATGKNQNPPAPAQAAATTQPAATAQPTGFGKNQNPPDAGQTTSPARGAAQAMAGKFQTPPDAAPDTASAPTASAYQQAYDRAMANAGDVPAGFGVTRYPAQQPLNYQQASPEEMTGAQRDAAERAAILQMVNRNAAQDARERALITGGDTGIYSARQGDIEESVGRALADSRNGQASVTNQMIRQAARYGWSPDKLAAMAGSQGLAMASQQAAAANNTRQAGIQNARGLLAQGYEMRNATNNAVLAGMNQNRSSRIADDARAWGKKLDVAGLYRNMPGASQGAYGLATNAGNSALNNQMLPGNAMLGQKQAAAGTIMQGQGLQIQGLGNVLNSQTSAYNASMNQSDPVMGIIGTGLGAWAKSDVRVKENIIEIGRYEIGVPMYEFSYKGDPRRFIGVMAQDVEKVFPEAVAEDADGIKMVDYGSLGIEMKEVA